MKKVDYIIKAVLNEALSPEAILAMARKAVESEHEGERAAFAAKLKSMGHDPQEIIRRANVGQQAQPKPKQAEPNPRPAPRPAPPPRPAPRPAPPPRPAPRPAPPPRPRPTPPDPDKKYTNPGWDPETIRRNRKKFDDKIKQSTDHWRMYK